MSAQPIAPNSFAFHTNPDGTPRFTVDFRQYCDKRAELLAEKPSLRTMPFTALYPLVASHIAKAHGVDWSLATTKALVQQPDIAPAIQPPAEKNKQDQERER